MPDSHKFKLYKHHSGNLWMLRRPGKKRPYLSFRTWEQAQRYLNGESYKARVLGCREQAD